ncbi:MAG: nicotinamide-nucleotide amidohydrolase family protein [Candidatus Rokubacteria bacterium]|nr:nicotinamide-nucleotide amidohydrolase family protein [Candidatus Rokubacteria bacterium]
MTAAVVRVITVGAAAEADPEGVAVAARLGEAGVPVAGRAVVEEDEAALERALAPEEALTVILAGAGGSAGDVVRRVLARLTGARLVLHERMLAALTERWRRLDRPLPRRAERLALLPQGAQVWTTDDGEPAWALESGARAFAVLPRGAAGPALEAHLVPFARARLAGRGTVLVRTLRVAGVELAEVEERLADWLGQPEGAAGDTSVATVPADGEVWVRLRARGATAEDAARQLAAVEAPVAAALGADCYGRDAETLEAVVGRRLLERGLTLAVAESCTGGLLGHRLTSVPGSSAYFERGVLVYSNRAKQELLGVPEAVLRVHGAVSAPCAEAMARGIAERAGAACALAITGIAGPDGGTPAKPVGTVFIGLARDGQVTSRRFRFAGDRARVKWLSTQMALDMLRRSL